MADRWDYTIWLNSIFIHISEVASKEEGVFSSSESSYCPYIDVKRVIILLILFKVDMIKAFFAAYKNVISVYRVNMFKPAEHFTCQFGQIDNSWFQRGKICNPYIFCLYEPDISILVLFQIPDTFVSKNVLIIR